MFNHIIHRRQAIVSMFAMLCGIWIGRVGLFKPWPVTDNSETAALRTKPASISLELPTPAESNGAQSLKRADTDKLASNNPTGKERSTVEQIKMRETDQSSAVASSRETVAVPALWQAPTQTVDGDIVISLEAAGIPQADAQNPTEKILGLIVQAN